MWAHQQISIQCCDRIVRSFHAKDLSLMPLEKMDTGLKNMVALDQDTLETLQTWLTTSSVPLASWTTERSVKAQEERILRRWATSCSSDRRLQTRPVPDRKPAPRQARAADWLIATSEACKIPANHKINNQPMRYMLFWVAHLKMSCSQHSPAKASRSSTSARTWQRCSRSLPKLRKLLHRIITINFWMPKTRTSTRGKIEMLLIR